MTQQTLIKFCGLVRPEDVQFAVSLQVAAIGLVFYEKSSRLLDLEAAKQLREKMPSWVRCVGLFVNAPPTQVRGYSATLGLDVVQFHGDETLAQCQESLLPGQPYWRAVRVREQSDLLNSWEAFPDAESYLLDAYSEGYGGSGQRFDWEIIPKNHQQPLIMSGGLNSASVGEAILATLPRGVDVSSGIQGDNARVKDHQKMQTFVDAVTSADATANQKVSR